MKALSGAAIDVLTADIEVLGNTLRITRQLTDRKLYVEVDKAIQAIGGKWNRGAKAHVFDGDPRDALDQVTADGCFHDRKRDLDQFFTPAPLAKLVVERARVSGCTVLEPSAGEGALAVECLRQGAAHVEAIEKDIKTFERLAANLRRATPVPGGGYTASQDDFLLYGTAHKLFDRVVTNPPFSRQQDLEHVTEAYSYLAPSGRLVAIMAAGVTFRGDKKTKAFRALVDRARGSIEELPALNFRESGTDVHTVLVTMRKP